MEFDRFIKQVNKNNFDIISNLNILIIGVGGVGSYTFESLVRSGVKNITIVDYDKIDITNLNRQVMTDLSNISLLKVDVLEKRAKLINKDINISKYNIFLDKDNISSIINNNYDYVIDCCDTVNTKKEIIKICLEKKIKFITCMGTGNKLDPSKLEICSIDKTSYDPLAKIIRKYVKDLHLKGKVMCVCSKEVPLKRDCISSNSFVPASAGLLITSYIINSVIDKGSL